MASETQEQHVHRRLAQQGLRLVEMPEGSPDGPYTVVDEQGTVISSGLDLDAVEIELDDLEARPDAT
jgi:hypothetical protein